MCSTNNVFQFEKVGQGIVISAVCEDSREAGQISLTHAVETQMHGLELRIKALVDYSVAEQVSVLQV